MLDKFGGAYGWTISQTASLTLFQLKHLSLEIDKRNLGDKKMLADVIRVANHGDKNQYDRFVASLRPAIPESKKTPTLPAGDFVYEEE